MPLETAPGKALSETSTNFDGLRMKQAPDYA